MVTAELLRILVGGGRVIQSARYLPGQPYRISVICGRVGRHQGAHQMSETIDTTTTAITVTSGIGMTLSFGIAAETIDRL